VVPNVAVAVAEAVNPAASAAADLSAAAAAGFHAEIQTQHLNISCF
jgi:hypothetical protein